MNVEEIRGILEALHLQQAIDRVKMGYLKKELTARNRRIDWYEKQMTKAIRREAGMNN